MSAGLPATSYLVSVEIDDEYMDCPDPGWFEAIVRATLAEAGVDRAAEVSLLVTSDDAVHDLNRRYRGLDEPTDVLSFAMLDDPADLADLVDLADLADPVEGAPTAPAEEIGMAPADGVDGADDNRPATSRVPFLAPPDGLVHLGEVIISHPRAVAQAEEAGHSPDQELAHLTVHGVLHLLGYDHEEPEEERVMRAKENAILGRIH